MKRHQLPQVAILLTPLLSLIACLVAYPAWGAADKPNILFILVDDLGKEWISCYGAENITTTNIDALAASGIKFNNAWCMPQCTPTRVTLLTGQYPYRHGWTNHWDVPRWGAGAHFDPKLNTSFAKILQDAGYATCAAGKWQIDDFRVEPEAMREAGFDDWCMWTGYETGNKPSANRFWDPYINTAHEGSRAYPGQFGPDVFCNHLIQFMRENKDRPMLLYYPMVLTHFPLTTTPDSNGDQTNREQFIGMVEYTDKMVGRLLTALEEEGIRDNTIVVFTTDNGTGGSGFSNNTRLGRNVRGGKTKMVEQNGVAQPFIVNCPGLVPEGITTDALIDFTDVLPTFAELGAASLPEGRVLDGKSFAPLILGKADDSPRDWILSMGGGSAILRDGRVRPAQRYDDRVIRDTRFKLWIDSNRKPTKLYDLQHDPWEEKNLMDATDPDVVEAKERLLKVAASFPKEDASPAYNENPPQAWDKKK